jgi:putative phosphoesterase
MIRVAIVADTHGHLDHRIEALVASCDIAVHGGDIGNAGVLARLQPRSGRVYAVIGNNDIARKWPEQDRGLLASLPDLARVALPGGELVVVHGHRLQAAGRHGRLRERYPGARVIVYGHSHRLVADRDALPWVLNPGAAGRARTFGGPSCMVLSVREREWTLSVHRFEPMTSARRPTARKQKTTTRPVAREQAGPID